MADVFVILKENFSNVRIVLLSRGAVLQYRLTRGSGNLLKTNYKVANKPQTTLQTYKIF